MEDKYAKNAVKFNELSSLKTANEADSNQDLEGFSSKTLKEKQIEEANKPDSLLTRKMKRIFGAASSTKTQFLQGFKMGAIVGGIFGGLMGLYMTITTRQLMYIPISAITSGGSFGFFMGLGMIMRSEMEGKGDQEINS